MAFPLTPLRKDVTRAITYACRAALLFFISIALRADPPSPEKFEAMRQDYLQRALRNVTNAEARARIETESRIRFRPPTRIATHEEVAELKRQHPERMARQREMMRQNSAEHREKLQQKAREEHLRKNDLNNDGKVTFAEEASVINARRRERKEERLKVHF